MTSFFNDLDSWVPAALLAVAMLVSWSVTWHRANRMPRQTAQAPTSRFTDASIAILGLLLAFTFSAAMSKYDQRRVALISDSNAIGDFGTCAALVREPVREKLLVQIRSYVQLRLSLAQDASDPADFEKKLNEIQTMHSRMQELVKEAIEAGTLIAIPLVNTFNGVTSSHAARLAAVRDRVPVGIFMLLFLSATSTMAIAGAQEGAKKERNVGATVGFVALVCLVVWVTLDLEQPMRSLINISQEPLQRLLKGLEG